MVEVGSVEIKGTINTSDIERGFARMELSMGSVKGKAGGFTSDLDRMENITKRLATSLVGVGVAGAAGMIALAKSAPAVAGSMAQMEVTTERLSRALGRELAPAFAFVSSEYSKFVDEVEGKGILVALLGAITPTEIETAFNAILDYIKGSEFGGLVGSIKEEMAKIFADTETPEDLSFSGGPTEQITAAPLISPQTGINLPRLIIQIVEYYLNKKDVEMEI